MKKNYLLLAIFLLLAGFTAWYVLSGKKDEKHTLGWDRNFKVEERDIQKIFLAKRTGVTTTLERDGDHWKVNGQWRASENAVENLLETVTKLELAFVPPPAAFSNITREMASRGIKVEIYGKNNKLIKAYYIGGVTPDAGGTYALLDGSEQPMVLKLPLMDGQIRTRYDLQGDDWRDRHIFPYKPEEIAAVSVEYPHQRNQGFKLSKTDGDWSIKPFYDNVPAINKPVSEGKVEGFLTGFEGLMAETFNNEYEHKDSIRQMVPFSVVSITDTKGKEKKAAFFPTYKTDLNTGERRNDIVERFFTETNEGDWFITQNGVFKKVFWGYDSFF
ncbi:MAG: DUF4340 domain-containing protein [Saprospiraceae bacterium]|nr:DUF4340 domain-containing protein [Saprospiraceae bacterium]